MGLMYCRYYSCLPYAFNFLTNLGAGMAADYLANTSMHMTTVRKLMNSTGMFSFGHVFACQPPFLMYYGVVSCRGCVLHEAAYVIPPCVLLYKIEQICECRED